MKKGISILFLTVLLLCIGTPAFAAEDKDVKEALALIEKTNTEIDEKIKKAVERADSLQEDYLRDVRKIEAGDQIIKLEDEKGKVLTDLNGAKNDADKAKLSQKLNEINAKMIEEQAKIEAKMAEIEQEISGVTAQLGPTDDKDTKKLEDKLNRLNAKLNEKATKSQEKTQKFTNDLDKVITDVYNDTFKISAETIKRAAAKGVQAECSWKLVRFANKWVWIDPIRVVGC
ncbi:hypothetical protein [Neobacillus dielmonensis]|uniref:hypothetical protein n=1 Tax=Neobacillus dielmonensis TaxID=1347369 RepID=UPI0005A7BF07|nr:hypothetical protein [Neobacillus dielmonensis]